MFWGFRIGSLFGIPIKLDVTFLFILPVFAYLIAVQIGDVVPVLNDILGTSMAVDPLTTGYTPFVLGLIAALGLFASVLLHELGHSLTAMRYGFPIESITLWLLGGVAQLSEMPQNWRQELAIAIMGPVVSVALGVAFYASAVGMPSIVSATPGVEMGTVPADGLLFVLAYLGIINVALAAFNMLPGFPMDGGRVLRALLARNRPYHEATAQAATVGKLFALGLALFGIFAGAWLLAAIAVFIYIAASGEARYTAVRFALEGRTAGDLMTPAKDVDTVEATETLEDLVRLMFERRHVGYPVTRNGQVEGIVTLDDVRSVPPERRRDTRVEEVMSTELQTIDRDAPASDALDALQRRRIGRLIVTDETGSFTGLLTRSDIVHALDVGDLRAEMQGVEDDREPRPPTRHPGEVEGPHW